jgi:DNA repair protein RecO (recombination protein O)
VKRVELEPAFVLHNRAYRETSLIIEVFGRDTGRFALVAKGVRRPKSALRGMLQSFHPLLLSWSGSGELGLLTGAEPDGYMRPLAGKALFSGLYINELLMRLMYRHDPHPELFHYYRDAIEALNQAQGTDESMDGRGTSPGTDEVGRSRTPEPRAKQDARAEAVLRIFEKQMLESIGYGLLLDRDIDSGEPIHGDCTYRYELDRGPTSLATRDGDGVRVAGETLLSLARESLETERALDEAKQLMRAVLRRYLGDKPLATRSLFRARVHSDESRGGRGRAMPGAIAEDARADESRDGRGRAKHDCRDAGGRAMPGAIAEDARADGTD